MPHEIERKFLVTSDAWKSLAKPVRITQGYLSSQVERTVRVRMEAGKGTLTIKGKSHGARRREYEYRIPAAHAAELLDTLCERPLVDKLRYVIPMGAFKWEVDEFLGENAGLVVAEIELPEEGTIFSKPEWIGEEVTGDRRYYNSALLTNPFTKWAACA